MRLPCTFVNRRLRFVELKKIKVPSLPEFRVPSRHTNTYRCSIIGGINICAQKSSLIPLTKKCAASINIFVVLTHAKWLHFLLMFNCTARYCKIALPAQESWTFRVTKGTSTPACDDPCKQTNKIIQSNHGLSIIKKTWNSHLLPPCGWTFLLNLHVLPSARNRKNSESWAVSWTIVGPSPSPHHELCSAKNW
jgi:hypothetical protein